MNRTHDRAICEGLSDLRVLLIGMQVDERRMNGAEIACTSDRHVRVSLKDPSHLC